MAVKISGVLKDGTGKPVQNCTIQLKAKRNSTTVVVNTLASENPDEAGRYSMDVEYGQYSVILLVEGFPPSHAGTITVYEDSQPGTLNDFLGAMTEDDARPEALRRFELMVEEVARNVSAVAQNTAAAKKSASDASTSAREAATHATDAAGSARAASTSAGQAASSAQSASSSAGTASTKATEASKSAAAAESSKSAAATSAGAAKTSETNAAASQQSAATSASTATTKASEAASSARDASASKEAAKSSETSAASSASSAASSATAAGNSAKAAKTSETNAKASETAAGQSASAAAGSDTAAASSAREASIKAEEAAGSATAAGKSAESAASSASTATTKAGEATEQATAAARSASAAKTSEINAKASETSAESSKTAAASSASSAASSASSASASKDEATRQASAAKGSATTASTKATEAAGSATAASQSKSAAESAATRAEAAATRAEDIASAVALEDASTTKKGVVKLSNSTDSTSQTEAATPLAVKNVMDALNEVSSAIGDDPQFATTVMNALAGKQPLNDILSSLAALVTTGNKLAYFSSKNVISLTDFSATGRSLISCGTEQEVLDYLGIKSTATLGVQKDIFDRADGVLALPGAFGFGALTSVTQYFSAGNGPAEFAAWCVQTPPGRYRVEQRSGSDINPIIPDIVFTGILEIKVPDRVSDPDDHKRKGKLLTFYGQYGDVYKTMLKPGSTTPSLETWKNGYMNKSGLAGLLGNDTAEPETGSLILAAYYGTSDSDNSRTLQRGAIYPGSRLAHVELAADAAIGAGVKGTAPVCYVRGLSFSHSLPGAYRALSGSQGARVDSSKAIVGMFVRIG